MENRRSIGERVRRARALARDPTSRASDIEELLDRDDASPAVTIAFAGASGCGKTALARSFFAESARRDGRERGDWRAAPTIGIDFGACPITFEDETEPRRVRGRFLDPSGAVGYEACRSAAYADADGVVVVLDPTRGGADARTVETILREIADARASRAAPSAPAKILLALSARAPAPSIVETTRRHEPSLAIDAAIARAMTSEISTAALRLARSRADVLDVVARDASPTVDSSSLTARVIRVDAARGVGGRAVVHALARALLDVVPSSASAASSAAARRRRVGVARASDAVYT
ncbi:hypothetical protein BE221DRAFT_76898 [Ostreococcus tauri]|uniref:P-loop containing nucleoside triphosphate hydrolase n=1 Tax=Ostreococcus tauri TaxID=70448 RepID=A0A1Y5IE26_OSTTA|nr:hypothetical protein BE221DRAFT_76898 [Ostreococcus tauri]